MKKLTRFQLEVTVESIEDSIASRARSAPDAKSSALRIAHEKLAPELDVQNRKQRLNTRLPRKESLDVHQSTERN